MAEQLTDEGIISFVDDFFPGVRVHLDNGNVYTMSRTCDQDPKDFWGLTVRVLLTEHHRIWDISVI
jgi:hypothetical protein